MLKCRFCRVNLLPVESHTVQPDGRIVCGACNRKGDHISDRKPNRRHARMMQEAFKSNDRSTTRQTIWASMQGARHENEKAAMQHSKGN